MADAQTAPAAHQVALADNALLHLRAASAADEVLATIAAGVAHPDALADGLLAVLTNLPEDQRVAAIRGYLRAVAKRLEALANI